jgi:hypothetical protein
MKFIDGGAMSTMQQNVAGTCGSTKTWYVSLGSGVWRLYGHGAKKVHEQVEGMTWNR